MGKTLILLTILLNSCITGKHIAQTGVEKIKFGDGGGFTGAQTMYTLNQDGDIKDKYDSVLHNMSKKDVLELYKNASKNRNIDFQKPENMYSFLIIITKSDTNRIIWGHESSAAPTDILDLHNRLMNKIQKNK